jgi:hypothetical protein
MYVKQCDCLKPWLWTTTFVDDRTSLIHYTFFKTKCNFRSLKKYFIDKYIYFKILSLIQKSLSSAETDLVESTTVWAGVTTKKLILDIFSIRPNCQPRVSRSSRHTQVMLQTVTLFYIHSRICFADFR